MKKTIQTKPPFTFLFLSVFYHNKFHKETKEWKKLWWFDIAERDLIKSNQQKTKKEEKVSTMKAPIERKREDNGVVT